VPVVQDSIAPLDRQQLSERWEALFGDPVFGDFPGKVELTEFGEVLVNPPVGKVHAGVAGRAVELLRNALGGHAIVEASILTDIGVRAPDVAWCSQGYWDAHSEKGALTSAPEICIEVRSPSDTLVQLRRKALAYLAAGAIEVWIVSPESRQVEIYGKEGQRKASSFPVDPGGLFA
jgi:Uma2 family endonuclease